MSRWFFPCTGGQTYRGDLSQLTGSTTYDQGQSPFAPDGNLRSIVIFDTPHVRDVLSSQIITACSVDFYVQNTYFDSGASIVVGTHNYTAIPVGWEDNRVNQSRFIAHVDKNAPVVGFDLGTTIGNELRNGVSTGVAFGPAPDTNFSYYAQVSPDGDPNEPVLVIDTISINVAPFAPTLVSPVDGAIVDAGNTNTTFKWTHRDPNGNAQASYAFARARPGGAIFWWNATSGTWQSTEVFNTGTAQQITFTPTQWAGIAGRYVWTVATGDFELHGPYPPSISIWQSTPPVADITSPSTLISVSRPLIKWNYSDVDGETQYGWVAGIVAPEVYNAVGWDPSAGTGFTWIATALNTATSVVPTVDLKNHSTYRAYVLVASTPNLPGGYQVSAWDFVEFQVAIPPFAPNVTYPLNGSTVDLAAGFTFTWKNNHFGGEGTQASFAIRRLSGSTFNWWSGSAWVTTETFLAGASAAYSFRPSEVANGSTFTFSVAMRDSYGQTSPYSSGVTVIGSTAAQVTVLSPPATIVVVNPIVTWSVFDADNDPQQTYQVRIIAASVYTAGIPDPGTATAVWDSGEIASSNVRNTQVVPDLVNTQTYRAYVRVKTGGVYSGWSYAEFTVAITPPAAPSATVTVLDDLGAVDIVIQGRDSILTADASRAVGGWVALDNCTVANGQPYPSSQSDLISNLTASATGNMTAHTSDVSDVVSGESYTAAASLVAGGGFTGVDAYVSIEFLDDTDTEILVVSGNIVTDTSALVSTVTATAPTNAVGAKMRVTFRSLPAAGNVHGVFDPVFRPGTGTEWSPGGIAGTATVSVIEGIDNRAIRRGLNVPLSLPLQRATVRDEEVAIGRAQRYELTARAVYEDLVLVSTTTVLDDVTWTSGWLWLSDPLRPGSGRSFAPQSWGDTTRPIQQGKFRPIGRPDAIVTTGTRGLREGTFTIVSPDRVTRDAYHDLVVESDIVLVRIPPDQNDPEGETIYVRLDGDAPESRPIPHRTPHRTIAQAWTEQLRPTDNLDYSDSGGLV